MTLAVVVIFNALAIAYAPHVSAGEPTPWIGLYERIAFSAYFLWLTVLAVGLWRRQPIADLRGNLADGKRASSLPTGL